MDIGIWNERFRPQKIEDLLGNEELVRKFNEYIERKDIPHLLFFGPAGVGKSTAAKILANEVTGDALYINASDERTIDVIREKVIRFCSSLSLSPFKVVILDEYDGFLLQSQAAMRNVMEEYHENSRFILTANFKQKIIDPIISRCQCYEFMGAPKKHIIKRCCKILKAERVEFELDRVVKLVGRYYPDIRKMINALQQLAIEEDGGKILRDVSLLDTEELNFVELIKEGKIPEIRKELARKPPVYEELYRFLFDNAKKLSEEKALDVMVTIAEFLYRQSIVVDPEINFTAMCIELVRIVKGD